MKSMLLQKYLFEDLMAMYARTLIFLKVKVKLSLKLN